jgi:hypothetical protein
MPLPLEAEAKLNEFAEQSGDFALFGIFLNPATGEMGTYSSHGMEPGAVLGFLQRAVEQMVTAAANNELEYIGGNDAERTVRSNELSQAAGAKIGLVH